MALWFDPFEKGRDKKLRSRVRFDRENGNFFITTALAPRGAKFSTIKKNWSARDPTRVENSRGSSFLDDGVLLPDRHILGRKYFENSSKHGCKEKREKNQYLSSLSENQI